MGAARINRGALMSSFGFYRRMSPSAKRLRNLRIDSVDTVDKAANPGAHVVLTKRDMSERADELDAYVAKMEAGEITSSEMRLLLAHRRYEPVVKAVEQVPEMREQLQNFYKMEASMIGTTNTLVAKVASGAISERQLIKKASTDEISKSDLGILIDDLAQRGRRDGESRQQAYARFIKSNPTGIDLFAAHQRAAGPDYRQAEIIKANSPKVHPHSGDRIDADQDVGNFNERVALMCERNPGMSKRRARQIIGTQDHRKETGRGATGALPDGGSAI
jgi:hypothetical protein